MTDFESLLSLCIDNDHFLVAYWLHTRNEGYVYPDPSTATSLTRAAAIAKKSGDGECRRNLAAYKRSLVVALAKKNADADENQNKVRK